MRARLAAHARTLRLHHARSRRRRGPVLAKLKREGTDCFRSPRAWPVQLVNDLQARQPERVTFALAACAGARTSDVWAAHQLPALSAKADLVTMTTGGNDLAFAIIGTCLEVRA
jgi:lysophospholipase L1-like esterase